MSTVQSNGQGNSEARVATSLKANMPLSSDLPRFSTNVMYSTLQELIGFVIQSFSTASSLGITQSDCYNGGYLRPVAAALFLQELGYGSFDEILNPQNWSKDDSTISGWTFSQDAYDTISEFRVGSSHYVSPFRILAYHKVYMDYYRNDSWQEYLAYMCNVDWLNPSDPDMDEYLDTAYSFKDKSMKNLTFFEPHIANYSLDFFNGMLPRPQFGESASVDVNAVVDVNKPSLLYRSDSGAVAVNNSALKVTDGFLKRSDDVKLTLTSFLKSNSFSISELRAKQALQHFKEISLSQDSNFVDQVQAHFGVRPSDGGYDSKFITGTSSVYQVDPQVNTNLSGDGITEIKGIASASGHVLGNFTSDTYGIIIGIHSIKPVMDYKAQSLDLRLTQVTSDTLPIPEFDSIGYDSARLFEIIGLEYQDVDNLDNVVGYRPRYTEYKVGKDFVYGDFNYTMSPWVMARQKFGSDAYNSYDFIPKHLPVQPDVADSIFYNNQHALLSDAQFYSNLNLIFRAVRPFTIHSLPGFN